MFLKLGIQQKEGGLWSTGSDYGVYDIQNSVRQK
jgi:hypothetical protein